MSRESRQRQPKIAPFVIAALALTLLLGLLFGPEAIIVPLFFVALVPALTFPLLYRFRSPWRTTLVGRMMMTKSSAVATVFLISLVRFLFPDLPGVPWIIAFAYAFLAAALMVQNFVLLREQSEARRGRRADVGQQPTSP